MIIKTITVQEFVAGKEEAIRKSRKLGKVASRLADMKEGECVMFTFEDEKELKRAYSCARAYINRHVGKFEMAYDKEKLTLSVMKKGAS